MPSIGQEDSPRFSVDSPSFAPSCSDVGTFRSFSYLKLPQQLLRLSILKLDGSSFDIQVERTASVDELKQAIEDFFNLSANEGQGKISWPHVWGHFCLCFEDQKLVNDKAYIRSFGIKDGDQIYGLFIYIKDGLKKLAKMVVYSSTSGSDYLKEEELHPNEYFDSYGDQEGKDKYFLYEDGKMRDIVSHTLTS